MSKSVYLIDVKDLKLNKAGEVIFKRRTKNHPRTVYEFDLKEISKKTEEFILNTKFDLI